MAIVYVLTNPAFEDYVKVGKTVDLEQRLRTLDNTSVPLPFRCDYAVEVDNDDEVERLVHQTFADHRTRSSREFFEIDPQRVIAALKLTKGKDVTPRDDIAEDEEGIKAIEMAARRKGRSYNLVEAGLHKGDELRYVNDENVTAEVHSDKTILFEGEETSLSRSALSLLHRDGYTWKAAQGPRYWTFEGETIEERLKRLRREAEDAEAGDDD